MQNISSSCEFPIFRYRTDQEIKARFAEIERKSPTIATFNANENEVSMSFPSLTITADVSSLIILFPNFFTLFIPLGLIEMFKHVLVRFFFRLAHPLNQSCTFWYWDHFSILHRLAVS